NMHNYWVGTAADSWRTGDKSVEWILQEAAAGEVFAAGHAEPGNETSIVMSATKAERVAGGYRFTGRKAFGSLTPVWTRLGARALTNFGNIYSGLAHRRLELTIEHVKAKGSLGLTRSCAHHPEVQRGIAEMVMELEAIGAHLDATAREWSERVNHGAAWPIKIVATKYRTVEGEWHVDDLGCA